MRNNETIGKKAVFSKTQKVLFFTGLFVFSLGACIIAFYCARRIYHKIEILKLYKDNPVITIDTIGIKAPILEGTDDKVLSKAVGHFENTGDAGRGNYCIAGHSSTIYNEYFNNLKYIEMNAEILLLSNENEYKYIVCEKFIVNPDELWILGDFADNRITIITCTDDGSQRLVVVGKLV